MAYQQRTYSNSKPATAAASGTGRAPAILSTGLFTPNKEGVKSIGSVQVKEDVLIPAGSFINLYPNDRKSKDNDPTYKLTVTAGKKKLA